jgi:hypothetical protein
MIQDMRLWNVHWAIHPVVPALLLDNLDIHDAEYGVWRPVYDRHAYHGLHFDDVAPVNHYGFGGVAPNKDADFPRPLHPVDDRPPITAITHVGRRDGKLVVRGTTSDNGPVKRVLVNEHEAQAVAANFAEWEVVLENPSAGEAILSAHAEDAAGNIEKTPHRVRLGSP